MRITTQLIRAADSVHLWSETYDRELSDVFAMQDEIAGAVVNQLKITLFGSAPVTRSTNTEAYTLYLSARQLSRIGTTQSYEESNALYKKALNLDPAFAEAWDGLAENYIYMAIEGSMPRNEGRRLPDDALAQALSRNPELVAAHRHRGKLAMIFDSDHKSASEHYTHALQYRLSAAARWECLVALASGKPLLSWR